MGSKTSRQMKWRVCGLEHPIRCTQGHRRTNHTLTIVLYQFWNNSQYLACDQQRHTHTHRETALGNKVFQHRNPNIPSAMKNKHKDLLSSWNADFVNLFCVCVCVLLSPTPNHNLYLFFTTLSAMLLLVQGPSYSLQIISEQSWV